MSSSISTHTSGNTTTIAINGEFTFSVNAEFRKAYKSANSTHQFVVDLSSVQKMDSAALGMLIQLREYLGGSNNVTLKGANNDIQQILDIANFQTLFNML